MPRLGAVRAPSETMGGQPGAGGHVAHGGRLRGRKLGTRRWRWWWRWSFGGQGRQQRLDADHQGLDHSGQLHDRPVAVLNPERGRHRGWRWCRPLAAMEDVVNDAIAPDREADVEPPSEEHCELRVGPGAHVGERALTALHASEVLAWENPIQDVDVLLGRWEAHELWRGLPECLCGLRHVEPAIVAEGQRDVDAVVAEGFGGSHGETHE